MRICLVSHGFPPIERTGVENYTAALAAELVRAGHSVEVFTPRVAPELPDLSMRREERHGYGVTWLTTSTPPRNQEELLDVPGVADRFGEFLDRERPEVVHFQHLIKLGMELPAHARKRDIPTIYTAHDYYPVCHRFTLVKPDMSRCETVGDPSLCARCDLGLSYLNRIGELGDYQLGALEEQLGEERYAEVRAILAGDPERAGFREHELKGFVERRLQLDDRRRRAYQGFDLVLSPTRFLADRLIEGGIPAERVELLTYGAETAFLKGISPVVRQEGRPLRFGYMGGLSKHKGVHVLVEAFERLEQPPEVSIWGDSSDQVYVETLRARAKRAGIRWRGAYRRAELASALSDVDVVVVPSIWVENYPFVIREAFAAGRPVIASDVGALPESVRHEVDGLLFAPGDAAELAAAMRRIQDEPGLLERLVAGIEPVKDIGEQARELSCIYQRLAPALEDVERNSLPASLHEPWRRYRELSALPLREIFRSVQSRLGLAKSTLLGEEDAGVGPLSVEALATGSKAQILLQDLRREKEWLKNSVSSHEKTIEALRDKLDWREKELDARLKEIEWLRATVEDSGRGLEALRKENDWLKSVTSGKEQEVAWLRDSMSSKDAEVRAALEQLDDQKRELGWLRDSLIAYENDLTWYQEKRRALEAQLDRLGRENEEQGARYDRERERLREGIRSLSDLASELQEMRERVFGDHAAPLFEIMRDHPEAATLEELASVLLAGNRELIGLMKELEERRREMRLAKELANRRIARLIVRPTGLGRHVARWRDSGNGARPDERGGRP